MTELTLFVKAFNGGQLKQIDELLQGQFEDLDVKATLEANPTNKWVHLSLEGEDEAVAASFARKMIGTVPGSLEGVEVGAELKGYVAKVDESHGQVLVDVGVFQPKATQAVISLMDLRAQFAASKESTVKTISEAYGIGEGLPITVKVTAKGETLKAELAPELVAKLKSWQQSLLDRLIILRAPKELVETTLERTQLERDVLEVEQLGFFEFSLTCKLGTDARGLIPRVGRYMRNAVFVVFNSKKSVEFLAQ
ncbi:MAG TPA: DUF2110 family protein [Candidatus Acidoferrales bacterium]|nr:DUF2110 family protein [Candidatus Acidoferrales bacterium]